MSTEKLHLNLQSKTFVFPFKQWGQVHKQNQDCLPPICFSKPTVLVDVKHITGTPVATDPVTSKKEPWEIFPMIG